MKAKKILAAVLAGTMVMGSAMTVMADTTGTAPVYSFDVVDVIVPTSFTVALNPQSLEVVVDSSVDAGETSTEQVLSYNYGIINNSTSSKKVTVDFTVTNADGITFGSVSDVAAATADENVLNLAVTPSNDENLATTNSFATTTEADNVGKISVTTWATSSVDIGASGSVGFFLAGGTYSPITGSEVELGTTSSNDVASNYELTAIGGVTAFTFTGSMNDNASWTGITAQPIITATYTFETAAEDDVTAVDGTDAQIEVNVAPSIAVTEYEVTAGEDVEIAISLGAGDLAATGIATITYTNSSGAVKSVDTSYYTYASGTLTISATYTDTLITNGNLPREYTVVFDDDAVTEVTITLTAE